MIERRFKLVFLPYRALLGLLTQDGAKLIRAKGLPDDAEVLGARADDEAGGVWLRVWSASYPPIAQSDARLDRAEVYFDQAFPDPDTLAKTGKLLFTWR